MRKLFLLLFMLLFSMTVMAQDNVNLCPDDKHPHAIFSWGLYGDPSRNNGYRQLGEDIAGSEYDVARYRWGSPWQMPAYSQFIELLNSCTMTSTTHKGVKGTLLTGPNGNSIFFPFAGYRWDVNLMGVREFGCYWTSTLRVYGEGRACAIDFYPDRWELGDGIRNNALTVRPIRP